MNAVRAYTADARGRAGVEAHRREAEAALARASEDLKAAFRTFGGFEHEEGARERIEELVKARDDAQALVDQLGGSGGQRALVRPDDIDRLGDPAKRLVAWRRLIADTGCVATVAPARSRQWDPTRIEIKFLGQ